MIKTIFCLLLLSFSISVKSQVWEYASSIESSDDFEINSSGLINDSTVVLFGTFKGNIGAPINVNSNGGKDIFIAKFINGDIQWFKNIGSTGNEFAGQMIIHNNEIYVVGSYPAECTFPDGSTLTTEGAHDVFLAKFSSSGSLLNKKKIVMGANNQVPLSLDIDVNNRLVLTGFFKDTVGFGSVGYDGRPTTFTNYFVKLDLNGNHIFSKTFDGNNGSSKFNHVKAFKDGYYIAGTLVDTVYFPSETIVSRNSTADIFLYKMDTLGNDKWIERTSGNNNDVPGSMTQDLSGNIYFTGYFRSDTLNANSTELINSNTDNSFDFFIYKFNIDGNILFNKSYGGKGDDWARSIETRNGYLYLSGYFCDTLIFKNDTIGSSSVDDEDPFIGIFNSKGDKIKAINVQGSGGIYRDHAQSINLNSKNEAIIGGFFESGTLTFNAENILTNNNPGVQNLFIGSYIPPYSATFTKSTDPNCNQAENGELIVTPYFGVPPFTYKWSHDGDLNDSTATNLAAGTYTVSVIDFIEDTAIVQYTLNEPDSFIFAPTINNVTGCTDGNNGSISISPTGGNGGNTYFWFADEGGSGHELTAKDQSGLTAGKYCVTVTDTEGCTGDTSMYITSPDPITFTGSSVTNYTDPGSKGAVTLTYTNAQGDPGDYAYSWTGPSSYTASTQNISDLEPGSYSVTMTDGNGCTHDSTFIVGAEDALFAYIYSKKDVCSGTTDGRAKVRFTTSNANPDISYAWSNGSTDSTISNVTSGTYTVTLTDHNNLDETSTTSVDIVNLAYTMDGTLSGPTSVDCYGDTDAYVDFEFTVSGEGQSPYTYAWSNSATTQDITGVGQGTYNVTVTDANECVFTPSTSHSISQPTAMTATASVKTDILCNGDYNGVVTVEPGGGNGGYLYSWNDPGSQSTKDADGLNAGYYTVTVTDSKGCNITSSIQINEPAKLLVSGAISDVDCNGGSNGTIGLNVTGGTIPHYYDWSVVTGSGSVNQYDKNQSGLPAGDYRVLVEDTHTCRVIDTFTVAEPEAINITIVSTINNNCNGVDIGAIDITVTGGTVAGDYQYNWESADGSGHVAGDADQTGLGAGVYNLTVTDDNLCTATTSVTITEPTPILINETFENISCHGLTDGSITTSASGGTEADQYEYTWSTLDGTGLNAGQANQTDLGAGTYDLTVTDDNSCVATAQVIILEPTSILINETFENISCHGLIDGTISTSASGGTEADQYEYTWSTLDGTGLNAGQANQTGLGAGTYDLTVTDDNNCEVTTSVTILEPDTMLVTYYADTVSCSSGADGAITLTITGGTVTTDYTYAWSSIDGTGFVVGDKNQTGLTAGIYNVTVQDDNLCEYLSEIAVLEPEIIDISISVDSVSCNGLSDGAISLYITGGTIDVDYTYAWASADGTGFVVGDEDQTGLTAGTYDVTVQDDNSCTANAQAIVYEPSVILISDVSTNVTCNGLTDGTIDITVSGGTVASDYVYTWSTSDGSGISDGVADQADLTAGTYNLTVTDDNLCTGTNVFYLTEPPLISITENVTNITCNGLVNGEITVSVSGGTVAGAYNYQWQTADGSGLAATEPNQTNLGAGTYNLTVTDDNSCEETLNVELLEPLVISITEELKTDATSYDAADGTITITASGGTGILSYTLNPGSIKTNQTGLFENLDVGDYTVDVTDENSCGPISSSVITISQPDNIPDIEELGFLKVYPNPVRSILIIEFTENYENGMSVELLNVSGQIIYRNQYSILSVGSVNEIDVSNYPAGIYFLRFSTHNGNYQKRIMIQ